LSRFLVEIGFMYFSKTLMARQMRRCLTRRSIPALMGGLLLAAQPANVLALPQSANPDAPAPQADYRPVIRGYVPFRPVEPRSWTDVNEQVAPKPRVKTDMDKQR
jgi:hypothetical protein